MSRDDEFIESLGNKVVEQCRENPHMAMMLKQIGRSANPASEVAMLIHIMKVESAKALIDETKRSELNAIFRGVEDKFKNETGVSVGEVCRTSLEAITETLSEAISEPAAETQEADENFKPPV